MRSITLFTVLIIFSIGRFSYAQEFSSPRATALGGYIAVSDDVYGIDWNISATVMGDSKWEIAFIKKSNAAGGRTGEDFRLLIRPGKRHVLAFCHTTILKLDHSFVRFPPSNVYDDYVGLRNLINPSVGIDWIFGYAFRLTSKNAIGLDIKRYFYNNIPPGERKFWSVSFSYFKQITNRLRFGIIVRNALTYKSSEIAAVIPIDQNKVFRIEDTDITLKSAFNSPEFRIEMGAAYRPTNRLLLSTDIRTDGGYRIGFEWEFLRNLYSRMAMSHQLDLLYKRERVFGVTWGGGYKLRNVKFDIAYYFAYGGRGAFSETASFGEFEIDPLKDDALLLSATFTIW